jgi:glycosyltransferase involved in cell wall biosynthesis
LATVVVPAYNQERFLAEAIESVVGQAYRPIECIIVDDGSTDGTARVAERFEKLSRQDLVIQCLHQPNQGAQAARNAGVSASHGEFIQCLDADDLLDRDKLARQVDFLASKAGEAVDVVYGDARFLTAKGDEFKAGEEIGMGPVDDILVGLLVSLLGIRFNPSFSYLSRRTSVQACGPWNLNLPINQDYDYFLRMACLGLRFHYVSGMTGFYRKHDAPRISDQGMSLRAKTTLGILESAEHNAAAAGLLAPGRRRAFAEAYRMVSYWASGLDRKVWRASLGHSLRLCPDLLPEKFSARLLQRIFGVWTSESLLGLVRQTKRNLRRT